MTLNKTKLNKLRVAIETLASDDLDKYMNGTEMRFLLILAIRGRTTQMEFAKELDVSQSHASRILKKFLNIGDGLGLVQSEPDPEYRKRHNITLTGHGMRVLERVSNIMN